MSRHASQPEVLMPQDAGEMLLVCVHSAGCPQMGDINPVMVEAMAELATDQTAHRPRRWSVTLEIGSTPTLPLERERVCNDPTAHRLATPGQPGADVPPLRRHR